MFYCVSSSLFNKQEKYYQDYRVRTSEMTQQIEFDPHNPRGRSKLTSSNCPLTTTCALWYVCMHTHMCTHTKNKVQLKILNQIIESIKIIKFSLQVSIRISEILFSIEYSILYTLAIFNWYILVLKQILKVRCELERNVSGVKAPAMQALGLEFEYL